MIPAARLAAVIFDLDGLLIDSEPLQLAAWEAYLARFGATMTPDVLNRIFGLRLVDAAAVVVEVLNLPVSVKDVVRDRDAIFLESVPGAIEAMPGAGDLIDAIRRADLGVGLATSGHRRYVDLALASAGLVGQFDVEVTGELVERGKPAPDVYLRAAELLGVEPAACLALEDAPNGVRAALSAGMACFAIPNHSTETLRFDEATAVLRSLDDVLPELHARGWLKPAAGSDGQRASSQG